MNLFQPFNRNKFQTPLRRHSIPNKSKTKEITLINPVTMESINQEYSKEEDNITHGPSIESPYYSNRDEDSDSRENRNKRDLERIGKKDEEEEFNLSESLGSALKASRDTSPRRQAIFKGVGLNRYFLDSSRTRITS